MKIHHIGIAVPNLAEAVKTYRDLIGLKYKGEENVAGSKVKVAMFDAGGATIELIEPHPDNEGVKKFIEQKGGGLHHIALQVDSVADELKRVSSAGIKLIDQTPRPGAHGTTVAFLHPKTSHGVLLELVEEKK